MFDECANRLEELPSRLKRIIIDYDESNESQSTIPKAESTESRVSESGE